LAVQKKHSRGETLSVSQANAAAHEQLDEAPILHDDGHDKPKDGDEGEQRNHPVVNGVGIEVEVYANQE
jgi:hypothetical protein